MQHALAGLQPRRPDGGIRDGHQVAVSHFHALGLAGGAGGVDQIAGRGGGHARERESGRRQRVQRLGVQIEQFLRRKLGFDDAAGGDDDRGRRGVGQNVFDAGFRQIGVNRHITGPELEQRHRRNRPFDAARYDDGDVVAGSHAARQQQAGQTVGAVVQLGVAEFAFALAQGRQVAVAPRGGGEGVGEDWRRVGARRQRIAALELAGQQQLVV